MTTITDRLIQALAQKPVAKPEPQMSEARLAFARMHAAWALRHYPHLRQEWLNK